MAEEANKAELEGKEGKNKWKNKKTWQKGRRNVSGIDVNKVYFISVMLQPNQ